MTFDNVLGLMGPAADVQSMVLHGSLMQTLIELKKSNCMPCLEAPYNPNMLP